MPYCKGGKVSRSLVMLSVIGAFFFVIFSCWSLASLIKLLGYYSVFYVS